jgi:hypothetical protein
MNRTAVLPGRGYRLDARASSEGVSCDENGPRLGPARLLRRTIFGFEPRPAAELDFVFAKTFGAPLDWRSRLPGLLAIASALDENNLALAMIGTLHLRLPVLNDEQAGRARGAEKLLKAFNPDEPRDERGRWTSGGNTIVIPPQELSAGDHQQGSQPFQVAEDLEKFRDMKCQEFISAFCRGSIKSVFPGQYLDLPIGTALQDAAGGSAAARSAVKLLSRPEYRK